MPLLLIFFHGKHEGVIWTGVFAVLMAYILINPSRSDFYAYETGQYYRFLTAFLFVSIIPPPPVVIILLPLKLSVPRSPIEPV